ncbi:geranylgeranyl pyrophosphate synthase [Streptomyces sp. B1I3]|nr:geranylgeranyl pyrophosphate synthase [Streptomyces sp. B1I3]
MTRPDTSGLRRTAPTVPRAVGRGTAIGRGDAAGFGVRKKWLP